MAATQSPPRETRIKAALGALAVQALLGYALITAFDLNVPQLVSSQLKMLDLARPDPPPPPQITPRPDPSRRKAGKASPANLRSRATDIVVPPPIVPPQVPPPVAAATKPGPGAQQTSGSSDRPGPGTGAGGFGNGYGSGGDGDGDGGGGDPPQQTRGRLKDSDYPHEAGEAGVGGTVSVRFLVDLDGRAKECRVTHSSGSRALDATTCGLIEERFRFRPALDEQGRPVRSYLVEDHSWFVHDDPPEERRR